ncbi:hypothetical protein P7C73_g6028, partial [Tremellales sp. Uapishka_1]
MDLHELDSTLPQGLAEAERDMGDMFRAAAMRMTTLYKSGLGYTKQAYSVGYNACLSDVLDIVQSSLTSGQDASETLSRLMDWAEAREVRGNGECFDVLGANAVSGGHGGVCFGREQRGRRIVAAETLEQRRPANCTFPPEEPAASFILPPGRQCHSDPQHTASSTSTSTSTSTSASAHTRPPPHTNISADPHTHSLLVPDTLVLVLESQNEIRRDTIQIPELVFCFILDQYIAPGDAVDGCEWRHVAPASVDGE